MSAYPTAPRIAVLGSANMDLVARTPRLPAPGETLLGTAFTATPGGKGANQAIAAARAGGDVHFLGAIGSDTFALELRETLVLDDVGIELLREVDGPSGVAIITVDDTGENTITVVGGANSTMTSLSDDELQVIANADVLVSQLEIPIETVTAAACHARANGTTVILNPSPATRLPQVLLGNVDVLVVNSTESDQLGSSVLSAVPNVVTTLGAEGATYRGSDGRSFSAPTVEVDVVDTTGAGDAFTGALAVTWRECPEIAVRWACAAGALATTRLGAAASLPTRAEIAEILDSAFAG